MTKLNKTQQKEWSKLSQELRQKGELISDSVEEYDSLLVTVREFRDGIVMDIDAYVDERSEKWHEGDKAQAISSWKDEWEGLDLDDIEPFELDVVDSLDSVPMEAE